MASILLDTIINETVHNFRGREPLTGGGDNPLQLTTSTSTISNNSTKLAYGEIDTTTSILAANSSSSSPLSANQYASLQQLDALDGLASLMQDVEMGQRERLFWILLFSLMVLVAAGGNLIVIYIVSTNKEMKSVTNYFLVNLSLADTMVSTLNVIFNFISMLNRYNAILHPLRPRMSHRHAIGWILLIWTLSAALAMPNIVYSIVVEDRLVNENLALTCTMIWPDGRYPLSSYDHIYNIVILVVTYLVPILTMAILYYNVGKELWGYEAIGENVEKQARALQAKKKIVKMMIVVVIIFALCWLPYHAFFVVNYYLPTIFQDGPLLYKRCYLIMYWLAMSNSMYNPIIIYFMNSKFCHEFKRVLCFIFCCRIYSPPPSKSDSTGQIHAHGTQNSNHYTTCSRDTTTSGRPTVRRQGDLFGTHQELAKSSSQLSKLVIGVPNVNGSGVVVAGNSATSARQQLNNSPSAQSFRSPIEVIVTQSNDNDNCDSSGGGGGGGVNGSSSQINHNRRQATTSKPLVQTNSSNDQHEQEPFLKSIGGGGSNSTNDKNNKNSDVSTSGATSISRTTNSNSANKVWI